MALDLGFDEATAERAAIVITEAGTNLLKHAQGGQIVLRQIEAQNGSSGSAGAATLEILALDRGPGMVNVEESMRDGHSTSGTSGSGLGAIGRLSSYSEIYSLPGRGTAVLARIASPRVKPHPAPLGAIQFPYPGEDVCGDDWGVVSEGSQQTFLLADGLGHGVDAARAARAAVDVLYARPHLATEALLAAVHEALRSTRGAAVSVAQILPEQGIVRFSGLGNVSGTVFSPDCPPRRMVSTNGTAGLQARHIREFTYPWTPGSILVMCSDGIGTHWDLSDYPGLIHHDPAIVAGVIFREQVRGNDDATVLAAR